MIKIFKSLFNLILVKQIKRKAIVKGKILVNRQSRIFHLNGSQKNNIVFEDNVMFFGKINCNNNGKISIGFNTSIRKNCIINCSEDIEIGNNVIFADNIIISDTNHHPVNPEDRLLMIKSGWSTKYWSWNYADSKKIKIGNNVWLGQYSRILKGVKIGDNTIIASNSVVTKDIPSDCIAAGNPAKIVKSNIDMEPRKLMNID